MREEFKLNFFELNLIYILCGFSFMTTIYSNPSASIIYRAIGILIPFICLLKTKFKITIPNDLRFKTYIILLCLYSIAVLYTLFWGKYQTFNAPSKNLTLLFLIGITWFPIMGYISNIKYINYNKVVIYIFFILLFVIGKGYIGISNQVASTSGRFMLNASQSTLTFGDKGMMLMIASFALLIAPPLPFLKSFFKFIFLGGVILGIMGAMKGGSRGPFLSGFISLIFMSICAPKNMKRILTIFILGLIGAGTAVLNAIHSFAPALFDRIMQSILTGDSSGRDSIFSDAFHSINFIIGGSPIILEKDMFFGYHNVYITLSMGIGIIPAIIFIILIVSLIISFYRKVKNKTLSSAGEFFVYGFFIFYIFRGLTGVNMLSTNEFNMSILMSCYICSIQYLNFRNHINKKIA
ncbi:MAG: hypothetical protein HDR85_01540 [Bacteroides sp.]|nr:hypothetical protein [Bacteroides sp.]